MKNKRKSLIVLIMGVIILGLIVVFIVYLIGKTNKNFNKPENPKVPISSNISIENYEDKDYLIIKDDYKKEYDLQYLLLTKYYENETNTDNIDRVIESFTKKEVMNYNDYLKYCNEWDIESRYSDSNKNYIVFSYAESSRPTIQARLADVIYENSEVNLYLWDLPTGVTMDTAAYVVIIPTEQNVKKININSLYTEEDLENIKETGTRDPGYLIDYKPIIYLYPTVETNVTVKLLNNDNIITSYPKYVNEWNVLAKPNGDLKDLKTNRNLYALYYESINSKIFEVEQDGFIVKGEDAMEFLEEKLEILGLNERESEEFIVYWLPKLEANKYNYIRFATQDEINENVPLDISPNPDSLIRILMTFKGLDEPTIVNEQKLVTPDRTGFVAVEWGGTKIK